MRALAYMTCDRPEYVQASLKALQEADLDGTDLVIFHDLSSQAGYVDVGCLISAFARAQHCRLVLRKEKHGVGCGHIAARAQLFDEGYDVVVQLEDDMVIAPWAVQAILRLHEVVAARVAAPVMVSMFSKFVAKEGQDWPLALRCMETGLSSTFMAMGKDAWARVRELLLLYDGHLRSDGVPKPYKQRDHEAIRGFFSWALNFPVSAQVATSQDAALKMACLARQVAYYSTSVSHAMHIGVHGEHCTPAVYERNGYGLTELPPVTAEMVMAAVEDPFYIGLDRLW